eukprot:TRINITY_DN1539_c0_g1_i2.p1 TRINITY_DN1539_c0_g1~~TRINITY_DN1539_c0_g1_i2.p1  ORF type:complete len:129 (-),score=10.73 TRINITY_DN1539_c0_g1_i2:452-838(-)
MSVSCPGALGVAIQLCSENVRCLSCEDLPFVLLREYKRERERRSVCTSARERERERERESCLRSPQIMVDGSQQGVHRVESCQRPAMHLPLLLYQCLPYGGGVGAKFLSLGKLFVDVDVDLGFPLAFK